MKTILLALLVAAAALAGGVFAGRAFAGRAFAPATDAVRTVDIPRILQQFEPMAGDFRAMQAKYQAHGDRLRQVADALKSEKGALAQLDKGSEEFAVRSFQVQRGETALEEEVEFWTNAQRRENEFLLDAAVRRIHVACEEYGRRSGVSAVLMRPGALPPDGDARNSLRDLEGRWVIWANAEHDVTDAILAILREQG